MRKCIATDTSQYDLWGKLICSNFKISFITDDPMPLQVFACVLFNYVRALTVSRLYCYIIKDLENSKNHQQCITARNTL